MAECTARGAVGQEGKSHMGVTTGRKGVIRLLVTFIHPPLSGVHPEQKILTDALREVDG